MKRKIYVLGSGAVKERLPDHIYVDFRPFKGVDKVVDLNQTPWPFDDGCARHINATHVIEHLHNFPAFMDEAWRLLHPGGSLFFEVPIIKFNQTAINLAFADPTHRKYFVKHSFINYLTVEGVHQHSVVQHAWTFVHLEELDHGILRGQLFPVPDECQTDGSIQMWADYKKHYSHAK